MRARKESGGGAHDGPSSELKSSPTSHQCKPSRLASILGGMTLTFYLMNSFNVHTTTSSSSMYTSNGSGENMNLRRHRYLVLRQQDMEKEELLLLHGDIAINTSTTGSKPLDGKGVGLSGWVVRSKEDVESGHCLKIVDHQWMKVPCGGPTPVNQGGDDPDLKWCQETRQLRNVQVGKSWGSLDREGQKQWETTGCNGIIELGRKMTCDEINGLKYMTDWREGSQVLIGPASPDPTTSRGVCADNYIHAQSCTYENVVVDFSKAPVMDNARDALEGFLLVDGDMQGKTPEFPSGIKNKPGVLSSCTEWEEDVTFVMAHDCVFNYDHFLADAWNVWVAGELHHLPWEDMKLINMDGIAGNGPAGGQNRVKLSGQPDYLSPFFDLYRSWFGKGVIKAIDYGSKQVCFRKIVFQPHPGAGHVWSDFSYLSECSVKGPSWMYQGYNRHIRAKLFGEDFKSHPRPSRPQITFIKRALSENSAKGKAVAARGRTVANEEEFMAALRSIPGVDVVFQDFATIPFLEQTRLIQNTSILIGFHGAGMAHLMQLPIGAPGCCGVVELTSNGFHHLNQFGNFARYLGLPFFRWEARDSSKYTDKGTVVDVEAIKELVVQALAALPP